MYKKRSKKLAVVIFALLQMVIVVNYTHAADWYPMESGTEEDLYGVWGSSGSDVFVVGAGATILHYDGTQWSLMESGVEAYKTLYGIWGFSATDIYVGGDGPTFLHYDGFSWSPVPWVLKTPGDIALIPNSFKYIWGNSPTNLFIAGTQPTGTGSNYGLFGRFDGHNFYPIAYLSEDNFAFDYINDLWGSSSTDIYLPGGSPYYGYIYHYDGIASSISLRIESETEDNTFYSIWGSAADDVFAAGGSGRIYHYDGSTWSRMETGITDYFTPLYGIWGISWDDVFVVGSKTFLHYNGDTWSSMEFQMPSVFYNSINDVWVSTDRKGFSVCRGGQIFGYNVVTATTSTKPPSTTTTGLSCPSEKIYGENTEEVALLRYLRDNVLNHTPEGREIIRLYYELSPTIVELLEMDEEFKAQLKGMIDGVLELIGE